MNPMTELRSLIAKHLDVEELRTLCFDLRVDFDSLRGEGKEAKVRELAALMQRTERMPEFLAELGRIRPRVTWPEVPSVSPTQFRRRPVLAVVMFAAMAGLIGFALVRNFGGGCGSKLGDAPGYYVRGIEQREVGEYACAERDFRAGLALATRDAERGQLYYGLASIAVIREELSGPAEAVTLAETGLTYAAGDPPLILVEGLALCRLGRREESEAQIRKYLDLGGSPKVPRSEIEQLHAELRAGQEVADDCYGLAVSLLP
jgi:hypothetical protein